MTTQASLRKLSAEEMRELLVKTEIELCLDTREAAALLGVTSQTLRRWACHGSGPITPRRVTNRLRWSVSDINRVLSATAAA